MTLRIFDAVVVLAVLSASAATAFAEDEIAKPTSPAARGHLTAGVRLYRMGDFEEAIKEYKAGALIEDAPIFYYNLGQAYRKVGNYDKAIWNYQRFLDRAKPLPANVKEATERFIREMTAEKEQAARNTPPTEPSPSPAPSTESSPPPPSPPPPETIVLQAEPWYADKLGWGLAGTGLAVTGVAVWLGIDAKGLDDDANAEAGQAKRGYLRDRADSRRLAGTIVGVAGGALLVAGIVKLALTENDHEKRIESTSIDVGLSPNGIAVMGRF